MSVVKDFGTLRKYNLESLLGLNDGDATQNKKPETAPAATESKKEDDKKDDQAPPVASENKKDDEGNQN